MHNKWKRFFANLHVGFFLVRFAQHLSLRQEQMLFPAGALRQGLSMHGKSKSCCAGNAHFDSSSSSASLSWTKKKGAAECPHQKLHIIGRREARRRWQLHLTLPVSVALAAGPQPCTLAAWRLL